MLLTSTELASKLGISAQTLRRWEKEGKITSKKTLGGHRRYEYEETDQNNYLINDTTQLFKVWNNFEYFCEKYCTVWNKELGKRTPFKLLDNQKLVLNAIENNNFNIIRQYRQAGITSLMEAYVAHKFISTSDYKVGVMVINKNLSNKFIENVNQIIKSLPKNIFNIKNKKDSIDHKVYNNNCEIKAFSAKPEAFKGHSFDLVFMDNFNWFEKFKEYLFSLLGNMSNGGRIILNSGFSKNPKSENEELEKLLFNFKRTKLEWWKDERFNKELSLIKGGESFKVTEFETIKDSLNDGWELTNSWLEELIRNMGKERVNIEIVGKD